MLQVDGAYKIPSYPEELEKTCFYIIFMVIIIIVVLIIIISIVTIIIIIIIIIIINNMNTTIIITLFIIIFITTIIVIIIIIINITLANIILTRKIDTKYNLVTIILIYYNEYYILLCLSLVFLVSLT